MGINIGYFVSDNFRCPIEDIRPIFLITGCTLALSDTQRPPAPHAGFGMKQGTSIQ